MLFIPLQIESDAVMFVLGFTHAGIRAATDGLLESPPRSDRVLYTFIEDLHRLRSVISYFSLLYHIDANFFSTCA
jgi:hypothetical protein